MPLVNYSDSDGESNEMTPDVPMTGKDAALTQQDTHNIPSLDADSQMHQTNLDYKSHMKADNKSIRNKFRTPAMKELLEGKKRAHQEDDDDIQSRFRLPKPDINTKGSSLISILPEPKNVASLPPSLPIESMLRMPDRVNPATLEAAVTQYMPEPAESLIDLSTEKGPQKSRVTIVDPTAKRKNQITYLAQRAELSEIKIKEDLALGRVKRLESKAKYGF